MKTIGQFTSASWGLVNVVQDTYGSKDGPIAIILLLEDGERLGVLSVNMYKPACSRDSKDLPKDCFYVKVWAENEPLAHEAWLSGLFIERGDLPEAHSGHVIAPVWQVKA